MVESSSHNPSSPKITPKEEPVTLDKPKSLNLFLPADQIEFSFDEIAFTTNNEVALLYPSHPKSEYFREVSDFISKCVIRGDIGRKAHLLEDKQIPSVGVFDELGFVRLDYGDYDRRMVKEVRVEIHGFIFLVDFVVIDYANEGEPFVVFKRDFLVTTKCKVDFGLGEIWIDLTMLEEERDIDV
ncbi:hypothetical protein Tco_1166808 [Tanacetum coccineum]